MSLTESNRFIVQVFVGALSLHYEALSVEASKQTTAEKIVACIVDRLKLKESSTCYELAEVVGSSAEGKERRLSPTEAPVQLMLLWPKASDNREETYRFYLREKDVSWNDNFSMDPDLIRDFLDKFLYQPKDREYPDLCQLPDLNEQTLLDNLRSRFSSGHIYTYVGSILIALNPFKFHPIYNPKYVKLYQNCWMGSKLPPHIFAVADSAYHSMLKEKRNQCVVISGESGSGKTESTNFLLHHLTALSQKGSHGSGVEQTILSAGPVLEAFGNAKTAHNNNSSRFGKFIQVNYKENGMVHGAVVQKYLLEKSRICSQARNERNYHVFYYLLAGATDQERSQLHLLTVNDYNYLNQSGCYTLDNIDEKHEFSRLKQSMEMVGFNMEKQRRLFSVLSAVLLLGNVEFQPRKLAYHHDEAVAVCNPEVVLLISELLRVRQETLLAALCTKRAKASGETLIINYRMREAAAGRDAMAKCLYGALFDWIVLQLNHALLSKKDTLGHHQGHSIGVLDIFGFEDFGHCNSFEQLCINFANEHLQFYFNQHVFKYEQEEYRKEGIKWRDISFMDNTGCLQLFETKPLGLLCILDDQCNFPGATNETLIQKFNSVHKDSEWYEMPPRREAAFTIRHYAGRVKYQVVDMREKNLDLMRQDIVGVLKNSNMAFVRELVGADPVAVFRWAIVRAFFRGYFAFHEAGRRYRQGRADGNKTGLLQQRFRHQSPNDSLVSRRKGSSAGSATPTHSNQRHSLSPNTRAGPKQESGHQVRTKLIMFEGANRSQVMEKANQIVMKNKSFRPRERGKKGLKNLQSVKTLAGRTQSFGTVAKRKQPLTVTAQFQFSLHSLMDTLNMANPFFIRCIKSNGHKIPNKFDDETVQRQLRYTGMLETVRIRQAGFNVRLSYDEFIHIYRILLVKGLLSSQTDVKNFLNSLNLDRENYQLGSSKIFLREAEKVKLDYRLHQQIMAAIITIQRWFRACLERRRYVKWREAAITIQSGWRSVLAQKLATQLRERTAAAITIQAAFRRFSARASFLKFRENVIRMQARIRGVLARRHARTLRNRLSSQQSVSPVIDVSFEDNFPLRPARSNQEVRTVIAVGDPNAIAPHKKKLSQRRSHEERSLGALVSMEPKRKGSCDSLASQKSSDSAGLPVKETISKAKKQLQALLRGGKKNDKWETSLQTTHSDGECEDTSQNGRLPHWCNDDNLDRREEAREFQSDENLDARSFQGEFNKSSPTVEENEDVWQSRRDIQRHQVLRRVPATGQDPTAPVRLARKARRTPRPESYSLDIADPISPTEQKEKMVAVRDDSVLGRTTCDPVRPLRERTPVLDDNIWLTRQDPVFNRTSSDPVRSSYEPPKQPVDPKVKKEAERRYSGLDNTSDLLEWNDRRTMFTICGHRFRKVSRFSSQDRCAFCDKPMDPILTQGHKCSDCKVLFHTKCIQNGGVNQMPCKRKTRKYQRSQTDVKQSATSKFSLTGTSQFTDSTDKIISDVTELRKMQSFIADKIFKMESEAGQQRNSDVDRVFRQALKEFKDNLVATYSIANRQGDSFNIKYKDLISNFTHAMNTVCVSDNAPDSSSVTMGVNAFRGFMNEFMAEQQQPAEKPKDKKRKKEKKRNKTEENIKYRGHTYLLTMINIPTACEVCNSFFMWPLERSLVCQNCKFTCHKKCYMKLAGDCRASDELGSDRRVFCVPLHRLATDGKVPLVVDRLITAIEMHGLYTEGLYRKPGVMPKVKELKSRMESCPSEEVRFEDYPVHVLASVLKSFFREMPEPLLTYDCYEDFLRATVLTDPPDRISTLFSILKKLPKPNFDLMERLIFHLARVASQEESNRMNPSALAIVFAPCILRTNKVLPAQDSLHDISKQTKCIETIIVEQLRKVKSTLADIDTLDTACHTASHRLSSLRSSKIFSPEEFHGGNVSAASANEPEDEDDEEALLVDHIQEIEKEKALLTSTLPSLTRTTSDDDLLSTDMDDGSLDDNYCGRVSQEDAVMV